MRFHAMSRCAVGVLVAALASSSALAFDVFTSPDLAPPNGQYDSSQPMFYGNGSIVLQGLDLGGLQHVNALSLPPTVASPPTTETFNSFFDVFVSLDGGGTFNEHTGSGTVGEGITRTGGTGQTGTFNTEMLQLNLSGTGLMIREDPLHGGTGQTTISDAGGGNFKIDSFFDVFTDLSLDGGQTWLPQTSGPQNDSPASTHLGLTSVPDRGATLPLLLIPVTLYALSQLRGKPGRRLNPIL